MAKSATLTVKMPDSLREQIRQVVLEEADHVLKDVEWRFAQALERERVSAMKAPWMYRKVTAEDLNTNRHMLTGYTVTNNSPTGGSIAWASLHIVYNGTDYTITDGNTALKYVWWAQATSTTVLQTSNTKPTLSANDVLVFVNNAGTAVVTALDSNGSLPNYLANGAVDSAAIAAGAVTSTAIASGAITAANGGLAAGSINASSLFTTGVVSSTALATGAVTATKLSILDHVLY